jgi:hypothetical protein
MTTYKEKLAHLSIRENELRIKERELAEEQISLQNEIAQLEAEQLAATPELTENETTSIRKAMSVVGKALTSKDVIFGTIRLEDEEPEETAGGYKGDHMNKYSIHMSCTFVEDHAIGLLYNVTIKTKNPYIKSIVRKMLGKGEDGDMPTNTWTADWDYYTKFSITDTISDDE